MASEAALDSPRAADCDGGDVIISSTATSGLLQLMHSQQTIGNRTEMHSGVRSATELLQQEIGRRAESPCPRTSRSRAPSLPARCPGRAGRRGRDPHSREPHRYNATVNGIFVDQLFTVGAGSTRKP